MIQERRGSSYSTHSLTRSHPHRGFNYYLYGNDPIATLVAGAQAHSNLLNK